MDVDGCFLRGYYKMDEWLQNRVHQGPKLGHHHKIIK